MLILAIFTFDLVMNACMPCYNKFVIDMCEQLAALTSDDEEDDSDT